MDSSAILISQKQTELIRNICILAHVDHGKTTLADSLVASNGIISKRLAGKLRYLDNRMDEQERGITMKSSSITLFYQQHESNKKYLVNLIDTPGHVDFSNEISTAVRLCDGALLVVDVVEGVCPQTRACLQLIYEEHLKPVLVLNKIDRLILEKQLTPLDAYYHILQVLEQVNASLGSIFVSNIMSKDDITPNGNVESAFENCDDANLYFNPVSGNVIFCSAYDGWGFTLQDFVATYGHLLQISPIDMKQFLWGDFYYNAKKKCVVPGAQAKAKKPMFVQLILENIWSLYDIIAVKKDKEKIPGIAERLNIIIKNRDLRGNDVRLLIRAVLGQWLPIERTVLEMVIEHIPAPIHMSNEKAHSLLFNHCSNINIYPEKSLSLINDFIKCDSESDVIVAFVAKMLAIPMSQLPQLKKSNLLTQKELQTRLDEERKEVEEADLNNITCGLEQLSTRENPEQQSDVIVKLEEKQEQDNLKDFAFIAFARIFSGTLRKGQKLYCLAPKHDPRNQDHIKLDSPYISEVIIGDLYIFMGGELLRVDDVPAGNIVGIGGLERDIVKTATLSNTQYCCSFSELNVMAKPILRIAIQPMNPLDMPKLVQGLKLLNQADACVQVSIESNGEHVITTLGEVHAEKCIRDLEESYARCKMSASKPIVSFRETIVLEAGVNMENEMEVKKILDEKNNQKVAIIQTTDKMSTIKVVALPLPQEIVEILEKYQNFFNELNAMALTLNISKKSQQIMKIIRKKLQNAFRNYFGGESVKGLNSEQLVDRIWSLGPKYCGSNILLNLSDYKQPDFWWPKRNDTTNQGDGRSETELRQHYNNAFINGFQLTTAAGPLCEEPMQGVCFVVLEWDVAATLNEYLNNKNLGPFSGQILNASKDACRQAFQNQPQRLVTPMYTCNIVVKSEVLGKMYAVLGRRHGKILSACLTQGSGNFFVTATLPVIESFNFAQEIRKQTSGLAYPQLMFSHWEVIDIDPFWVPTTEEEFTHYGEKADSGNRAKLYMNNIRRRKGLSVDDKVVEHAEKQRNLGKNK